MLKAGSFDIIFVFGADFLCKMRQKLIPEKQQRSGKLFLSGQQLRKNETSKLAPRGGL